MQFGKAVLRDLGWKTGHGIGRQKDEISVEPIEYINRQHRLGLGATALSKEQLTKIGGDKRK